MENIKDVVQVEDGWYVLATSSRTDERTRVLKHDEMFGVFDRWGDIQPIGLGEQGLYFQGTRFLSMLELTVNQRRPMLLNSTVQQDNALMVVDLTLPDLYKNGKLFIRKGVIHLFRSKLLWQGRCYEHIRMHNYGEHEVEFDIELKFDADYLDMFEVRGSARHARGKLLSKHATGDTLTLGYDGLDGKRRCTKVTLNTSSQWQKNHHAHYTCKLTPGGGEDLFLTIGCEIDEETTPVLGYEDALRAHREMLSIRRGNQAGVFTSNEQFNDWLNRSGADLRMLTSKTEFGDYPYAGIPWFSTPFGRDALITAMQTCWLNPELSKGVLSFLAANQADKVDADSDAEPGKILHEMRGGEMAALGEVPFAAYYGSIDSTPLFIMLAGMYYRRSADRTFIEAIWPNIVRALDWMSEYGDRDGDGFLEYFKSCENGLVQQGWKDSDDSVFHQNGEAALGPIALCEVQSYAYEAKLEAATIARMLNKHDIATSLEEQAATLKTNFNKAFWCEDIETYAIALDGDKRPCKVRSSNVGHVLTTDIVEPELAKRAIKTLLAPESFNGWGIRTIPKGEARYNPMSYHNGSIWPHDSAMVAAGLARFGDKDQVHQILTGLFDASIGFDLYRLPELFCGFERLSGQGPTLYPVACLPQAWASGTVFHLLQSCLGIVFSPDKPQLRFYHPQLPDYLHKIEIKNLRFPEGEIDLVLKRHPRDVGVNVTRKQGDIEVAVIV